MRFLVLAALFGTVAIASASHAADATLTIKDHKFNPAEITVPANEKITLTVKNEDSTPAEFDSSDLKREKVITGGKTAIVKLGPLQPGKYNFMEEFHEETGKGVLIVK